MSLTLFGEVAAVTPAERKESQAAERKRKARLAYDATSSQWKQATYHYAVTFFLPLAREPFIFEDLTTAYEDYAVTHRKPLTVSKRAFATLRNQLVKEGLIEVVPGRSGRSYEGNLRPMYRSVI